MHQDQREVRVQNLLGRGAVTLLNRVVYLLIAAARSSRVIRTSCPLHSTSDRSSGLTRKLSSRNAAKRGGITHCWKAAGTNLSAVQQLCPEVVHGLNALILASYILLKMSAFLAANSSSERTPASRNSPSLRSCSSGSAACGAGAVAVTGAAAA